MAKRKIIWSYRAKSDLINILTFYIERNGSKTYSLKLNTSFRETIRLIEKSPKIGIKTDFENVRNIIVSDYCIFYEITPSTIEIITIWDSRQEKSPFRI